MPDLFEITMGDSLMTKVKQVQKKIQGSVVALMLIMGVMPFSAYSEEISESTKATLGPKSCANCHKISIRAWKNTHHFKTFKELPKRDSAKEIAGKMGIKRMKSKSDCLDCHFTSKPKKSKTKVVAGISCESCHGPARDWMDIHSDFGGKGVKAADETPEHKVARYEQSVQKGMIRPANLYDVGKNCYSCHTVPNEKLVNIGGHTAGSEFELVQWSQGEVRHNVWYDESTNNPSKTERLRMMYVIGKALDLEYALRGLAKVTEEQKYYTSMSDRYKNSLSDLQKISGMIKAPELGNVIAAGKGVEVKPNNQESLLAAADKVSRANKEFANKYDGSQFAGIDALLPAESDYKGTVFQP